MKPVIEVSGLTKEYGAGRGVFDLNFTLGKGEVFGFLGPNGAGKTTTIRQLMGFIRPQKGSARILEMDCFRDAKKIQAHVGYLPGELALPDDMTGEQFLRFMAGMKGVSDLAEAKRLSGLFEQPPLNMNIITTPFAQINMKRFHPYPPFQCYKKTPAAAIPRRRTVFLSLPKRNRTNRINLLVIGLRQPVCLCC